MKTVEITLSYKFLLQWVAVLWYFAYITSTGGLYCMTYYKSESKTLLIEQLNECESDLRELAGQKEQQQARVFKLIRDHKEEELLELVQLSSQPDYSETYHYLSLLWSYKDTSEERVIPEAEYAQALSTIIHVSDEIIENWPALTPKKVSRLGLLLKGAANVANK